MITHYNKVLEGNKRYVTKKLSTDEQYFKRLSQGQTGCSDSRVPPNELTETDPGEIFSIRNIANLVVPTDLNLNCVFQYAVEHLNIHSIIVMGRTCCGGIKAALTQDSVGGLLDLWLNQIKIVYEKHQDLIDLLENEDDKSLGYEYMEKSYYLKILAKRKSHGQVPHIIAIMVHGWLFRVETGYIEELLIDSQTPEEMSKVFALKFKLDSERKLQKQSLQVSPRNKVRKRFQLMQKKIIQNLKKVKENIEGIEQDIDPQQLEVVTQNSQKL